jgi:hypothetical protein
LKINKKKKILLRFSLYLLKISHSSEVSYEDWIKCYVLFSKALYLDGKLDDALELLRGILDIFANIPLDDIKYLSEINKNNKISLKNNFFNFDFALSFYSKYHVYSKCEAIFKSVYKTREYKISREFNIRGSPNVINSQNNKEKNSRSTYEEEYYNDISDVYTENYSNKFNESSHPFNLFDSEKSLKKKCMNLSNDNSFIKISDNGK